MIIANRQNNAKSIPGMFLHRKISSLYKFYSIYRFQLSCQAFKDCWPHLAREFIVTKCNPTVIDLFGHNNYVVTLLAVVHRCWLVESVRVSLQSLNRAKPFGEPEVRYISAIHIAAVVDYRLYLAHVLYSHLTTSLILSSNSLLL